MAAKVIHVRYQKKKCSNSQNSELLNTERDTGSLKDWPLCPHGLGWELLQRGHWQHLVSSSTGKHRERDG